MGLTILGIIIIAIGTYIMIKGQSKSSQEDKTEIINSGQNESKEIKDRLDKRAEFEKILVTPSEIVIPSNASREVPVVITNNYPYPVFTVVLEIKVEEGDIDLSKDFSFHPAGTGVWQAKYFTSQVTQINSGASLNCLVKINGSNYKNSSRLKLSINYYSPDPPPDFTKDHMDSLPKTIIVPKGFVPPMKDNK